MADEATVASATDKTEDAKKVLPWWAWTLIGIGALIIIVLGTFGVQAMQVKSHEEKAISIIKQSAASGNLKNLPNAMKAAQKETEQANNIAHNGLWNMFAAFPGLGVNIQSVQGITDVVNNLVDETAPQYATIAAKILDSKLIGSNGAINAKPIMSQYKNIMKANKSLNKQVTAYNKIPQPNIGKVAGLYNMGKNVLNKVDQLASEYTSYIPSIPLFLGSEHAQRYVICAMTPSEMRMGGGLVGAIGTVALNKGKIEIGEFKSNASYVKYGSGEQGIDDTRIFSENGGLPLSYDIRDTSNYIDTSLAASAVRTIYDRTPWGKDKPINGVVFMDPVVIQELVKITGDVTMPDGRVLNGNNTAEFLLNTVYKDYDPSQTDAYFSSVANACIERLMKKPDLGQLMKFAKSLPSLAKQRHIAIFSFNTSVENIIDKLGLTGHSPQATIDPKIGVYFTEQNPSKMGWYIKRTADVKRISCNDSGSQTYRVTYTIKNTLPQNEVNKLPTYISGVVPNMEGISYERILFFPPRGGNMTNFSIEGDATEPRGDTYYSQNVYQSTAKVYPDSEVVYSFDVTTPKNPTKDLVVDQTPDGDTNPDVTYDNSLTCPVQ